MCITDQVHEVSAISRLSSSEISASTHDQPVIFTGNIEDVVDIKTVRDFQ